MKIIITAAGLGSRFQKDNIKTTKYKIIANERPLLYWSLISLKGLFNKEFIFIFRKDNYDDDFVKGLLETLGINKFSIILIDDLTAGQAETVMAASNNINEDESLLIFNIDTYINPNSLIWEEILINDGCIVTTNVEGNNWSFAKLGNDNFVSQVSEKIRISDYASVGIYYFNKFSDFKKIFSEHKNEISSAYKEIYVCPMYQYLIDDNKKVSIFNVDKKNFTCLGTPEEITLFDKDWRKNNI